MSLALKESNLIEKLWKIFEQKNWVRHIDIVSDDKMHTKESGTMHMMHSHFSGSMGGNSMGQVSSHISQNKKHPKSIPKFKLKLLDHKRIE